MDAGALIEASGEYDGGTNYDSLYATSDRGGSDTPLDGDLSLDQAGPITRIQTDGGSLRINDNSFFHLRNYFNAGGGGDGLYIYVQTQAAGVAFLDTSTVSGGNTNTAIFPMPADFAAIVNGISTGERVIWGFALQGPIALEGSTEIGAPILSAAITKEEPLHTDLEGSSTIGAPIPSATITKSTLTPIALEGSSTIGNVTVSATVTLENQENNST